MTFDKSRVYTALNADELKVGAGCMRIKRIEWERLFRLFKIRIFNLEIGFKLTSHDKYAIIFYAKPRYSVRESCGNVVRMFLSRKKAVESAWRIFNESLPQLIDDVYYSVDVFDTFDERFGEGRIDVLECYKGDWS